uniref:TLDc domain-containing protein n=1 Tax=Hemiselmis andersenii TaxID=464988 RepID=A0A7S0U002_HEMAN
MLKEATRQGLLVLAFGAMGNQDHAKQAPEQYTTELDKDFYGTSFEVYHISRKVKRKGGSGGSEWCGELSLSIRQCNWLQKNVFLANGSTGKLGNDSLLYLASRDGFRNSVFHKLVDLKGPTCTLVKLADGHIFGGFASVPWTAGVEGKYVPDPSAYLFSITDGSPTSSPILLKQSTKSPEDAVFHDPDLGPCFGRALGLQLDIPSYSSSDFRGGSKYRVPPSADDRTFLAGSYNGWNIMDVAVFFV